MNTTAAAPPIPEGFRRKNNGTLVPEETIRPIDLARDGLVQEIVAKARTMSGAIGEFKAEVMDSVQAFVELSAGEYGVQLGGAKGNVTLTSFDGRYKVLRAIQEHQAFDERLQAAKALIDACFADWTADARPEIKALIDRAFEIDQEGRVNVGRVLALRRIDIADERWQRAMKAIGESLLVVGSKSYIRVYERVGNSEAWRQIPLDVAGASS